jgi:hypothetical protein
MSFFTAKEFDYQYKRDDKQQPAGTKTKALISSYTGSG